ncbi:PDZ domain-containing protein MAGIX [Dryobates pubescens]|uniref:PDZ domain-containing protein MAGIX n=1 Tax=Dryobates pubescens TaxID=118200 RepID=UPI0023BA2F57|nr:PDZ domain-containing protein MAGIX [Dryobates pubescens]
MLRATPPPALARPPASRPLPWRPRPLGLGPTPSLWLSPASWDLNPATCCLLAWAGSPAAPSPPPFAVELPRGPRGFGFSLRGGRDLNSGVYVRGLREGGPAQRCGRIQVSDQLLAINGAPTAGMTHAQALARIRGGGSRLRLLLRRAQGPPQNGPGRGVLSLCVSSSPRGELCFCLVGRMDPPP